MCVVYLMVEITFGTFWAVCTSHLLGGAWLSVLDKIPFIEIDGNESLSGCDTVVILLSLIYIRCVRNGGVGYHAR